VHDIYSLGVILLEIGCWREAAGFDKTKKGFAEVNDERLIQEQLVKAAKTYLNHMTGKHYTEAVITCLTNGFEKEAKEVKDPSLLHKAFFGKVIQPLIKILASL
jgi:hypothetical protein